MVSAPCSERMDTGLSERQEKDIATSETGRDTGMLKHSGEAAMGKAPTSVPGAGSAQLRLQLVWDQIRKEANPGRRNFVLIK